MLSPVADKTCGYVVVMFADIRNVVVELLFFFQQNAHTSTFFRNDTTRLLQPLHLTCWLLKTVVPEPHRICSCRNRDTRKAAKDMTRRFFTPRTTELVVANQIQQRSQSLSKSVLKVKCRCSIPHAFLKTRILTWLLLARLHIV